MENSLKREQLCYRILSGVLYVKLNKLYILKPPSLSLRLAASNLAVAAYEDSVDELYDEVELIAFLLNRGFWGEADQTTLETFEKNLEELKVKYFQLNFSKEEERRVQETISFTKKNIASLLTKRHSYDYLGAAGFASMIKNKYLLGRCLYNEKDEPIFPNDDSYFIYDGGLLNDLMAAINDEAIADSEYRDLARNEPWRSIWATRKSVTIFPCAINLSDEQKNLLVWSTIYDNIYESPECPPDEVISNDDRLDGWMILQRRKRQKSILEQKADKLLSDKTRNADEVYIMANPYLSDYGLKKEEVEQLNNEQAKSVKRQREALLRRKGEVRDVDMPDQQTKLRMLINQRYMKGK